MIETSAFSVVQCPHCTHAALPWMDLDDHDQTLWRCTRCDGVLSDAVVAAATPMVASALKDLGYLVEEELAAAGCGSGEESDGGGCGSCSTGGCH